MKKEVLNFEVAVLNNEIDITSRMDALTAEWKRKIEELDIDNIAPIEDNKKKLVALRVDLNAAINSYDEEITKLNKLVTAPITELRNQYKNKLKPELSDEIEKLKNKIAEITKLQLAENENYAKEYLANKTKASELKEAISYKDIPWKFNHDSSKKSIRDAVDAHFKAVEDALLVINNHPYSTQLKELWYKYDLDLGKAMVDLQQQLILAEQLLAQKLASEKAQKEAAEKALLQAEADKAKLEEELKNKVQEEVVEVPINTEVEVPVFESIDEYTFKAELTESQLETLINYFVDNDISFDLIK